MTDNLEKGEPTDDEKRVAYEIRRQLKDENRQLRERLEVLEAKKHDEDLGISDDSDESTKKLARELRETRKELAEVSRRVLREDVDDELEPYYQRVVEDYPELKDKKLIPDASRRMEAARVMAEGLRSRELSNTRSSQDRKDSVPRVHLSGGGPSASKRTRTDSGDWEKFQEKMRDPKLSSDERKALADKWDADHPE